ncbi:hypothetical protein GCM10009838_30990 [Catenulispora subtropica]|uniref:Uncharacterized protein n=1 Tax=Catenulispora subtropica TaxID=450798 RepID=A0ABN2RJG0_9ACTN
MRGWSRGAERDGDGGGDEGRRREDSEGSHGPARFTRECWGAVHGFVRTLRGLDRWGALVRSIEQGSVVGKALDELREEYGDRARVGEEREVVRLEAAGEPAQ